MCGEDEKVNIGCVVRVGRLIAVVWLRWEGK